MSYIFVYGSGFGPRAFHLIFFLVVTLFFQFFSWYILLKKNYNVMWSWFPLPQLLSEPPPFPTTQLHACSFSLSLENKQGNKQMEFNKKWKKNSRNTNTHANKTSKNTKSATIVYKQKRSKTKFHKSRKIALSSFYVGHLLIGLEPVLHVVFIS